MTTLQDIMGLITKRKIKTPTDNDYIVSAAYTDTQERLKPQPKMEANLLSIGGIKKYVQSSVDIMPAYSIKVNNTNATTNAAETTYRSPGIQTYTGSIAWTGTTAPSGTTTHSYNWIQVGNLVTLNITLRYAVAGSALTAVLIDLPSDCPSPVRPSGLTSANEKLYIGSGRISVGTTTNSTTPLAEASIRNNSTVTGFQVYMQNAASLGATLAQVTIQYFTS